MLGDTPMGWQDYKLIPVGRKPRRGRGDPVGGAGEAGGADDADPSEASRDSTAAPPAGDPPLSNVI